MVGLGTLKYYNNLYKLCRKGLHFTKAYQTKFYNWFPSFFEQDLWLPKFIEGHGLIKDKPGLNPGVFTICGPEWAIEKTMSLDEGKWSSSVCPNLRMIRRIL